MPQFSTLARMHSRTPFDAVSPAEFIARHRRSAPASNKRTLPAAMPHGVFIGRTFDTLCRFSGLVQLDYDAKHNETVPASAWPELAREVAEAWPSVVLAQVSASGSGLWALVAVEIGPDAYDGDPVASHRERADLVLSISDGVVAEACARVGLRCTLVPDAPVTRNLVSLRFPGVGPAYFGASEPVSASAVTASTEYIVQSVTA